jgi:hypothetical protein
VRLSWRELAVWLMGWYDFDSDDQKKLDAVEHGNVSDEARLKAVVEVFLLAQWGKVNTNPHGGC